MDRDAYHDKAMMLLSDEQVYRKSKKDPTLSAERKMNSMLINLKKRSLLPEKLYERLRSSGGHIPLFCGLPKIHKETIPWRPIASFVSSPMHNLSKFLAKALSPLAEKTASHVSSSTDFTTFTKTITIPHGFALVAYDIISLFTNVPTDLAVEVIKRRLEEDDSVLNEVSIPTNAIISLVHFCLFPPTLDTIKGAMTKSMEQLWVPQYP